MNRGWENPAARFLRLLLDYITCLLVRAGTKRNDETGGLARKENPPWLGYERYGLP